MHNALHVFRKQSVKDGKEIGSERRFIMKSNRIRILAMAVLGFVAVCASPKPAAAQNAWQGSFILPTEVHWQGAVLPAGEYTFAMDSAAKSGKIVVQGKNASALIPTGAISTDANHQPSQLILERRGDSYFVREIYSAGLATHFRYTVPAAPKSELLAQERASTERLLIAELRK
jgi:hypothetical protein